MSDTPQRDPTDAVRTVESVLTHVLEAVVAVCFVAILALVVTLVVLRYVFNSSITGANELITVLFVYTTAIGAAVAVGRHEHIAVTFAVERLPPRLRRVTDGLGLALIALINAVLVWESLRWIRDTGAFLMPSTGLPRAVAQLSVPVGCGFAVVYCLIRLLLLATGKELAHRGSDPDRR